MSDSQYANLESGSFDGSTGPTGRAISSGLEQILGQEFKVLDHGFVRVVDYMGNDSAIVQAARVSYGRGTKKVNEDRGLIRYLMRHNHTTPFEMCEIKFHIKLPIFIARQWIRHRTANVNEYSARYSILDKEFYVPLNEHISVQSSNNKQGRGDAVEAEVAERIRSIIEQDSELAYKRYLNLMGIKSGQDDDACVTEDGIARELARITLNLNFYTQWYWKIDLHNLFHFLALRADPHAQYEIRAYAEVMLDIVRAWVPHAYEAFEDYKLNNIMLSAKGTAVIKKLLKGERVSLEDSGLSKREFDELMEAFS